MGAPVLGPDQVYIIKNARDYHTRWCPAVDDRWQRAPRGLMVSLLSDAGTRTPCPDCERSNYEAGAPPEQEDSAYAAPVHASALEQVIPLRVVGVAHGILFLAAGQNYRERLQETSVEPATPLLVDGRREGTLVRIEAARDDPLLVVQLDPRATFRDGPYQLHLRRPLLRSASKPYAVEAVKYGS